MPVPDDPAWPLEPAPEALRQLIDACAAFVVEHVESLPAQPSFDVDGAADVAASFREPVPEAGHRISTILGRLRPAVAKTFTTAGPGYLAFIPGGGIVAAGLADFIACAVNRFVGVAAAAPALAQIEATVVGWLSSLMGYPPDAAGILTSGGSISNLTAVATARIAKLPEDFLSGTLYFSEETHLSLVKAARIAGFSERNLRWIPVDERFRLVPERLEEEIRADRSRGLRPFFVVANVGTTNTGAVDPIPDILEIARRHDLWVHADAAYGGFFRLVPGGEKLMPGIERCDSITLDPHKGLFLPYGTGCLLVQDPQALRRAHQGAAGYLQDVAAALGQVNFTDISPELSRDFRGLRVWLPIQLHGLSAFREQLQEKLELTQWAGRELRDDPLFHVLDEPQLSIVAFTAAPRRGDPDAIGAEILRRVNARKRVFLSSTTLGGRYVLRLCVLSFRTHLERVKDAVTGLKEEARRVEA
ncbi:MAG TPA: aminotransferase class V-fold PLP-dependent enzyme [Candidatus Polarisedimenticolia bacterium]|jgi:aromatic-L-amino-acid decarboxylase|nr:aminotransferase class V-fold PLP-dependent enzyme [Candidatus Polarisedimenticolia bacterium]